MTMKCLIIWSACFPLASSTTVATAYYTSCLSIGVAYMQPVHVRLLPYLSMPISLITITFSLREFALQECLQTSTILVPSLKPDNYTGINVPS